jgi:hypothetical protein
MAMPANASMTTAGHTPEVREASQAVMADAVRPLTSGAAHTMTCAHDPCLATLRGGPVWTLPTAMHEGSLDAVVPPWFAPAMAGVPSRAPPSSVSLTSLGISRT